MNRDSTDFLLGEDVPHVYMHASVTCCLYSFVSTQTFRECADSIGGQMSREKKSALAVT